MNTVFDYDEKEVETMLPPNFDLIAKRAFTKYDKDKSGNIDINELLVLLKEVGRELFYDDDVTVEDAKDGMKSLDMNHNNVLEYEEFRKLFAALFILKKSQ